MVTSGNAPMSPPEIGVDHELGVAFDLERALQAGAVAGDDDLVEVFGLGLAWRACCARANGAAMSATDAADARTCANA